MKRVLFLFSLMILLLCTIPVQASPVPAKAKITSVKKISASSTRITWKKAKRAKKYELYVSINGAAFKKLKTTKSTSFFHKKLKAGKTYAYKVRGINGKKKGDFSAVKKIKTPSKKVLSVSEKKMTIYHFGSLVVTFLADDYSVHCSVSDPSVLDYEWGSDWFNNNKDTNLYLIGKKNGTTYVTISNDYNKEKCKIKVTVTENELGGYSAETETSIFGNAIKQMGEIEADGGYSIEGRDENDWLFKVIYYPYNNSYSLFSYKDDLRCEIHYDPKNYKKATILCGYDGSRVSTVVADPTAYKAGKTFLKFKNTSFVNNVSIQPGDPYPVKEIKSIVSRAIGYLNQAENELFNGQTQITLLGCEKYVLSKKLSSFSLRGIGWPQL